MLIGVEDEFVGVIDLVKMVVYIYDEDKFGENWDIVEILVDMKDEVESCYDVMIEMLVDVNDDIMEKYFEGVEIFVDEIKVVIC